MLQWIDRILQWIDRAPVRPETAVTSPRNTPKVYGVNRQRARFAADSGQRAMSAVVAGDDNLSHVRARVAIRWGMLALGYRDRYLHKPGDRGRLVRT